jgi:hypothetical protein
MEKNTAVGRFLSKESKARKKSKRCKLAQQVWEIFERAQVRKERRMEMRSAKERRTGNELIFICERTTMPAPLSEP